MANQNVIPAEIAAEWHPTKNGILQPNHFSQFSHKEIWWLGKCGHEWKSRIAARSGKTPNGCSICNGKQILAGFNDLASSFPEVAKEWHPTKNSPLSPAQVASKTIAKYWWKCSFGHEWEASISNRTRFSNGCPYCSGRFAIKGVNDLASQNPNIASQWHPLLNKDLLPTSVKVNSHARVWWLGECGHEWKTAVSDRAGKRARGCPVCSGLKVLAGFNDLLTLFPSIAEEWHSELNGELTPSSITTGSNKNVWWLCRKTQEHIWKTAVFQRTKNASGCPECSSNKSKAETEIYNYLAGFGASVKQSNRRIIKGYEVDIYLPDYQVAIEYNGLYWHSDAKISDKEYHLKKWRACREVGISLIFIWEDEWMEHPEEIKEQLNFILEGKQPHLFLDEPVSNGSFSEYWLRRNGNEVKEIFPPSSFYVDGKKRYFNNTTGKYHTVWDAGSTIFENSIQE